MQNKIDAFQGLRGWAILLVFLSHCDYLYNVGGVNKLKSLGGVGVSLFIILSGFLLAKKFIGNKPMSDSAIVLYRTRWSQFYRIHFITLLMAVPFSFSLFRTDFFKWIVVFLSNLTLIQALFPFSGIYFSFNAVSWFLSIVMIFAVMSPVAFFIWERLHYEKVIYFILVVNVFEFVLCYFTNNLSFVRWIVYINPFVRFLDFLIGGCLFLLTSERIKENKLVTRFAGNIFTSVAIIIFLVVMAVSTILDNEYFSTAVWTIPSCLIILALYSINKGGVKPHSSCIWFNAFVHPYVISFGNISFEFFMVHQLMIRYFSVIVKRVFTDGYNWYLYVIAYACAFIFSCCFAVGYKLLFVKD